MINAIIALLGGIFGFISKNPLVLKMALFTMFLGVIYLILQKAKDWLFPLISELSTLGSNITFILCKVGFIEALNIVLSAYIVSFILRHGMGFVKG